MYIDPIKLNYIIQIIENNFSITNAAHRLHISQSALSQFISHLENSEDIAIFYRGKNNRIEGLTNYGQILYSYAKTILKKYDEMTEHLNQSKEGQKATLKFGLTASYIRVYFPDLLSKFLVEYPNIQIEIVDAPMPIIANNFLEGKLDFALLVGPLDFPPNFADTCFVTEDTLMAYFDRMHPLASNEYIKWDDLRNYSIFTLPKTFQTHQRLKRYLDERNMSLPLITPSPMWEHLMESAHHTPGITILPGARPSYITNPNIVVKPIIEQDPFDLIIGRMRSTKYPKSSEIFFHFLKKYIEDNF